MFVISYFVTGSEEEHGRVREVILNHLGYLILHDRLNSNTYSSIEEYLQVSSTDRSGTWLTTWLTKHYTLTLQLCQ